MTSRSSLVIPEMYPCETNGTAVPANRQQVVIVKTRVACSTAGGMPAADRIRGWIRSSEADWRMSGPAYRHCLGTNVLIALINLPAFAGRSAP